MKELNHVLSGDSTPWKISTTTPLHAVINDTQTWWAASGSSGLTSLASTTLPWSSPFAVKALARPNTQRCAWCTLDQAFQSSGSPGTSLKSIVKVVSVLRRCKSPQESVQSAAPWPLSAYLVDIDPRVSSPSLRTSVAFHSPRASALAFPWASGSW